MTYKIEKKVYYHDTDAGGVVYYGRYLAFLEEARTELIDSTGLSVKSLIDDDCVFAVRECRIQYKRPARYGDRIVISAKIVQMSGAQIQFEQTVSLVESGDLLVTAEITLVCLSSEFRPKPIPARVRALLLGDKK